LKVATHECECRHCGQKTTSPDNQVEAEFIADHVAGAMTGDSTRQANGTWVVPQCHGAGVVLEAREMTEVMSLFGVEGFDSSKHSRVYWGEEVELDATCPPRYE